MPELWQSSGSMVYSQTKGAASRESNLLFDSIIVAKNLVS